MSFLKKVLGTPQQAMAQEIEQKQFQVSECPAECGDCNFKFPSSVKIDEDANLWNSINPYDLHILIPTGKTDWSHDAFSESKTYPKRFNKWLDSNGIQKLNVKANVCSLPVHYNHDIENEVGDLLVLPHFIWIKKVHYKSFDEVLPKIFNNILSAKSAADLVLNYDNGVTVSIDKNKSWIFLCSHRTRDKRCGVTAPIMKKEMEVHLRDLGLQRDFGDERPNGIQVGFINHIGGHKYSANVIIYLKDSGKNIWLARCNPSNVKPIIDECILKDGNIWPEKIRLIQKFQPHEW